MSGEGVRGEMVNRSGSGVILAISELVFILLLALIFVLARSFIRAKPKSSHLRGMNIRFFLPIFLAKKDENASVVGCVVDITPNSLENQLKGKLKGS